MKKAGANGIFNLPLVSAFFAKIPLGSQAETLSSRH